MKKILTALLLILALPVYATGSRQVEKAGQPVPTNVLDAKWLVIKARYLNHNLYFCESKGFLETEGTCKIVSIEDYVKQKLGARAELVGLSPFLNERGDQLGVVIYYRN